MNNEMDNVDFSDFRLNEGDMAKLPEVTEYEEYRDDVRLLACVINADEEDQAWMIEQLCVDMFKNPFAKHIFRKIRNLKRAGFKVTRKTVARSARWPFKEIEAICNSVTNYKHSFCDVFDVDFWEDGGDLYGGFSIKPL